MAPVDLKPLTDAILLGDPAAARERASVALAAGASPRRVHEALIAGMGLVGGRFTRNEAFVPEVLHAARAMRAADDLLRPALAADGCRPAATAVIGTVRGDLHQGGKNLVATMWRGVGLRVIDLGANVSPERFAAAAVEHAADAVGLSAVLPGCLRAMAQAVAAVKAARPRAKVIVGGAAASPTFAEETGADGYATDAGSAAQLIRDLLQLPF